MSQPPPSDPRSSPGFSTDGFTYFNLRPLDSSGPCVLMRAERQRHQGGDTLAEPVFVKRARNTEDLRAQRRLLEEARVMLMLDHPSIPRVLELVSHSAGLHMVLEYVESMTLERLLNQAAKRKQPVSEPFAATMAEAVADALHHLHTRTDERGRPLQLVHRGVSPRTVRVTERGGFTLTDFGAVRAGVPGEVSTDRHVLKGEVEYAAPEVLQAQRPDGRADLFSVGLVLVELLTLQHLYDPPRQARPPRLRGLFAKLRDRLQAETPRWGEPAELAARAARLQPVEVARVLEQVSEPLREILLRTLLVNPDERYPTVAALREELRGFLRQHHPRHGPEEVVGEVMQVVTQAAREHGVVQTTEATIPAAFRRQLTAHP